MVAMIIEAIPVFQSGGSNWFGEMWPIGMLISLMGALFFSHTVTILGINPKIYCLKQVLMGIIILLMENNGLVPAHVRGKP